MLKTESRIARPTTRAVLLVVAVLVMLILLPLLLLLRSQHEPMLVRPETAGGKQRYSSWYSIVPLIRGLGRHKGGARYHKWTKYNLNSF